MAPGCTQTDLFGTQIGSNGAQIDVALVGHHQLVPRCTQIGRSGAWADIDGAQTDSLRYLSISVLRVSETDNENFLYSVLMALSVNSITQAMGYEFKWEDQSIYLSKDLCEFTPWRQWLEITLPVPTEAPPQPAPLGSHTELIRAM